MKFRATGLNVREYGRRNASHQVSSKTLSYGRCNLGICSDIRSNPFPIRTKKKNLLYKTCITSHSYQTALCHTVTNKNADKVQLQHHVQAQIDPQNPTKGFHRPAFQTLYHSNLLHSINHHKTCSQPFHTNTSNLEFKIPRRFSSSSSKTSSTTRIPTASLQLGHPLPLDEHACSVSLPTWSSVVGYEEGSPQVTDKLACGYPRFVYHPYIIKLMEVAISMDHHAQKETKQYLNSDEELNKEWDCLVLPNRESALRCHDFLVRACGYHDGQAVSPKIAGRLDYVGNTRIKLFAPDNALDPTSTDVDCSTDYDPNAPIRVLCLNNEQTSDNMPSRVHAVIFPAKTEFAIEAKSYWQHTGEIVSSRLAEKTLTDLGVWSIPNQASPTQCNEREANQSRSIQRFTSSFFTRDETESSRSLGCSDATNYWTLCPQTNQPYIALYPSSSTEDDSTTNETCYQSIKDRISSIVGLDSSAVFLTHSGMASIYAALRSARRRRLTSCDDSAGGASVVYGFPYLDTLKMCSRSEFVPDGVEFFGHGDSNDLDKLQKMLEIRKEENKGVSVLITEYPSNPLLKCPDLHALRDLADTYDFALVVDDTIGNFANVDLIQNGLADVVCTSLTKLFNGRGDAMAGSVVANTNTRIGKWIQNDMMDQHSKFGEVLWHSDASAVYENSFDFLERSSKINQTAEALADWLKDREEVCSIYYPKFTSKDRYDLILKKQDPNDKDDQRHDAGYGGLMSIILHPHICQRTFYDKLDVSKGPSLGTNFTLVCPYTLLAHYHELDFAMSYQVKPNLLRISVGLEDLDELKEKFQSAFCASKLHPKLPAV